MLGSTAGNRRRIGSSRSQNQKKPTSRPAKVQLTHGHVLPSNRLPVQRALLLRLQPGCLSSAHARPQASLFLKNTFSVLPWYLTAGPAFTVGQKTSSVAPTWCHVAALQGLSQRKRGSVTQRKLHEIAASKPKASPAATLNTAFSGPPASQLWALSLQGSMCFDP